MCSIRKVQMPQTSQNNQFHLPTIIKPSTADTHCVQQLISSWKDGTAAHITKMLVDVKNEPLESYTIGFNLSQAELKAVWKKKGHFSASGIGGAAGVCCFTSKLNHEGLGAGGIIIWYKC